MSCNGLGDEFNSSIDHAVSPYWAKEIQKAHFRAQYHLFRESMPSQRSWILRRRVHQWHGPCSSQRAGIKTTMLDIISIDSLDDRHAGAIGKITIPKLALSAPSL
ncbi:hypothetical protein RJZ57_004364 [Blastomyces gilchristii]